MREFISSTAIILVNIFNVISYFPQIYRMQKLKRSVEISVPAWIMWNVSFMSMVVYGLVIQDGKLAITYSISVILSWIIIAQYFYYRKKENTI